MVKLYVRVCYLCNQQGETKEAEYTYKTKPLNMPSEKLYNPEDREIDVCEACAEVCKSAGLEVWEIKGETEIEM